MAFKLAEPYEYAEIERHRLYFEDEGHPAYYACSDGTVEDWEGRPLPNIIHNGRSHVKLDGVLVERKAVISLAFRDIRLPLALIPHVKNIKVTNSLKSDHVASHHIPFFADERFDIVHEGVSYRRIPCFNGYAIALNGDLLTIKTRKVRKPTDVTIAIKPARRSRTRIRINQLLAYAYLPSPANTMTVYAKDIGGVLLWYDYTAISYSDPSDSQFWKRIRAFYAPARPNNNNTQAIA